MKIRLRGTPGEMVCAVTEVPAFPDGQFTLGYPEAIGDVAGAFWPGSIRPTWEALPDGAWVSRGELPGQLA